jgi:hypothetical protein
MVVQSNSLVVYHVDYNVSPTGLLITSQYFINQLINDERAPMCDYTPGPGPAPGTSATYFLALD